MGNLQVYTYVGARAGVSPSCGTYPPIYCIQYNIIYTIYRYMYMISVHVSRRSVDGMSVSRGEGGWWWCTYTSLYYYNKCKGKCVKKSSLFRSSTPSNNILWMPCRPDKSSVVIVIITRIGLKISTDQHVFYIILYFKYCRSNRGNRSERPPAEPCRKNYSREKCNILYLLLLFLYVYVAP